MRHFAVLLGLALIMTLTAAAGLLAVGCSAWNYSPGYIESGTTIPAHTERRYAAMSLPAFAADGSLYVMNGNTLLHYSADGQRLGSSTLPVNIPAEPNEYTVWPRAYATHGGDVFVTLCDKRVGLLNGSQQFAWVVETGSTAGPLPLGASLLVQENEIPEDGIACLDLAGAVCWSVPGVSLYQELVQVDEQYRACICRGKTLTVKQEDGGNVLEISFPEVKDAIQLIAARFDRFLLKTNGSVTCIDLAGERLWQVAPPGGAGQDISGLVLSPERFVLHKDDQPLESVIVVDGQGRVLHQSPVNDQWSLLLANGSGYLAGYFESAGADSFVETWGWFNAGGVELWKYHPPLPFWQQSVTQGEVVPIYPRGSGPVLGADDRIYFERNSTLYALDLQGNLIWQDAGKQYYDVSAEAQYIW